MGSCIAKSNFRELEELQNKTLRMVADAPWYMLNDRLCEDLGVPSLAEYSIQLTKDTLKRSSESDNPVALYTIEKMP